MNEIEVAWAAGLFEGEGWFTPQSSTKNPSWISFRCGLASTDLDVLVKFQAIVGVGRIGQPRLHGKAVKPLFTWLAHGSDAEAIATLFYPHLGVRRRERIHEMIAKRRAYEAQARVAIIPMKVSV